MGDTELRELIGI